MPTRLCPICKKPQEPKFKPFCSGRCADHDLHRWLVGAYSIEGIEAQEDEVGPAAITIIEEDED